MGYFNYHSNVKKKISECKVTQLQFLLNYNGIAPCMLICFDSSKPMPIRENKWFDYLEILSDNGYNLSKLISVNELGFKLQS